MNISDRLTVLAGSQPAGAAIQTVDGVLSFKELDHAVSATAQAIQNAGISPGDVVAMALPDQVEQLIASLGLARLGAGQLVFHASDTPDLRAELSDRLPIAATITHDASKSVAGAPVIAPPPGTVSGLRNLPMAEFVTANDPDLTLFYQRSSGTTSRPRLGRVTHEMMPARIRPLATDRPGGKLLSLSHIDFDGAKHNLYRFLLAGGCVAFCPDINLSVEATIDFVLRHKIDFIAGSPIHATTLLDAYHGKEMLLPDLKAFRMSSTTVPASLRREIIARLTPNLYVGYGITEIGIVAIAPPQIAVKRPDTVGWIGEDITAEIVDEAGQPLGPGIPGELRVRSPGLIDGYVGEPEETAKRFRNGWFYSGDRCAFADDGALIHLGRVDDVIIFDGINIYPSAIESALLEHPAVAAVTAFGVEARGHGAVPIAAVILAGAASPEELIASANAKLGPQSPRDIMIMKEFPMTTAGKVIKRELAATYRAIIKDQRGK